ncbi:hypothetical protein K438DRAFT_1985120 [Mycena galopus ATCC 62051]|nr:hypothetical protein K438DRAFT_1985120 [Mycena galopus ATCC 62051]
MLGQAEIAKYFDQCLGSKTAIEEVLSGYIVWKYIKGATSERVLLKLRYLSIYLRVTGRRHVLEKGADVFKVLTPEVALGGGRIGLLPATTAPGKAVWNAIRRAASLPLPTDSSQPLRHYETRSPWSERYFVERARGVQLGEVTVGTVPDTPA